MDISVFDNFPDGVLILDQNWTVKYLNASATAAFHLTSMRQLMNKNILEKFPDLNVFNTSPLPDQLRFREIAFHDAKLDRKFILFIGAQILPGTSDILIYARDVSVEISLQHKFKKERREKSIAIESALTDTLTGCYNKEGLYQQLEKLWARIQEVGGVFSLLVLDLDNFKSINDNYGHSAGDQYLERFADILKSTARDRDVIGRFGGDEFVLIAKDCTGQDAQGLAGRILARLSKFRMKIGEHEVGASASIGISENKQFKSWKKMFEAADAAALEAKRAGKNTFVYVKPNN